MDLEWSAIRPFRHEYFGDSHHVPQGFALIRTKITSTCRFPVAPCPPIPSPEFML